MTAQTLTLAGTDLDPDIARFIAITSEAYRSHPPFETLSPTEIRAVAEAVREPWVKGGPVMVRTEEHSVPTPYGEVRVRLHDPLPPSDTPKPVLIYVHGGGWMLFSINTHDRLMREYAARGSFVVIGVDYSHAPAARFPVALNEVLATLHWVRDHAKALGVDADRIAIGGDSVGGNMSVAAALSLRDSGEGDVLKGLVLNYGAFDDTCAPEDVERYGGDGYMLTAEEMVVFWDNYLNSDTERQNPLVVPMRGDMTGLPPAFFAVAQCDVLRGQSLKLAEKMQAVGVASETVIYPGASHSFLEAVSIAPLAGKALEDGSQWLRKIFAL
ncbi:alpha/beta hydrolase fold domain-containing protein [Asticcacaulis sp. ZE23SCel15]|uniref:alpha/beta hydrolase fold domain-containing protein n=1 Tax=Asticcacaulis sp. ZE23SCel15 TaxID=3059027 RepID=UPI00265E3AF6|nr:alpha/beta hydrolase fold domain-containing protein [Asticcacaulis sp. ZE23SCel15]WKL57620.1 alpha/beta hydrolase fold domain-containing protein [Asticcacaulis sp. ZE23SCel15]